MTNPLSSYQAVCRPGTGAGAFFASILVWGVGIGCFGAAFNNFLVETYDINGFDRGVLEFLRETPGVLLVAIFAALWGGRLIGRLVDRWGYRNVMIWDTVVLFFVCLLYGFAKDWFPYRVAVAVVCVNYVLDAVLSNASMATNLYARTLSDSQEELTATLSSGISVNHVVTVFYALAGGWIWDRFGPGVLFATAAFMALANSAFALTVPKPVRDAE